MARASKWVGLGIAFGMAIGANDACATTLPALAGVAGGVGQTPVRPSRIHNALSNGINSYQKGDYEAAAVSFQEAQAGKDDLTGEEQAELKSLISRTAIALKARREGLAQLQQAELAMNSGRTADAEALLKSVTTNQFLGSTDQVKARRLADQLRSGGMVRHSSYSSSTMSPSVLARTKVQQARLLLGKANFDAAEALAHEAEQMNVPFGPGEDSPRKILDEISQLRGDPKGMLSAGRRALQTGDLDRAEALAHAAERTSGWTVRLFGDSPSKLLRDVQAARMRAGRDMKATETDGAPIPNNDAARMLVKQGRQALQRGEYSQAKDYATQAQDLHVDFHWWEDNPTKLNNDIQRLWDRTKRNANIKDDKPRNSSYLTAPAPTSMVGKAELAKRPELDAGREMASARALFSEGKYKEARAAANRAERLHGPYSVWEVNDRPSKLIAEIDAAEAKKSGSMTAAAAGDVKSNIVLASATEEVSAPQTPLPPPTILNGTIPTDLAKQRAMLCLAEARALQKDGRLVESRRKILEAQKQGATFSPNDESPERMLLTLAGLATRRIESLIQEATDYAATANMDSTRYQKAEDDLDKARQLAQGFALDTQAIERNAAWIRRNRADMTRTAPYAAPDMTAANHALQPAVPQAPAIETGDKTGQEMLQKARIELSRGELETARRLAVEVYNGPYGLKPQADAMLHSIDAEEYGQRGLQAGRAFDAGMTAYMHKDYSQAGTILRSLDPALLNGEQQAKLKEMMMTPELQPKALTQTVASSAANALPSQEPGRITVSDAQAPAADQSYAKQVQALQEIEFQKLRDQGMHAQRDAMERFRSGDAQQAMEILNQYLDSLNDKNNTLEPERLVLLRRPVEARLQFFKTLRAQKDYEKLKTGERDAFNAMMTREAVAEEHKQKRITDLMKQYHDLYKEGKYREAEIIAKRAHELAPDDAQVAAAVQIAETHANQDDYTAIKGRKEDTFRKGLNEADDPGQIVTAKEPMAYDNERWATAKGRKPVPKEGYPFTIKTEKEKEIERKLGQPISFDFKDTPLKQIIEDLREWTQLNIVIDQPAIEDEQINLDKQLNIKLDAVMAKTALDTVLHQAHLIYVIKDEVVMITTEAHARGKLVQTTYLVADLVIPVDNQTMPNGDGFENLLKNPAKMGNVGGNVPAPGPGRLPMGTQVGAGGQITTENPPAPGGGRAPGQTIEDLLIKLITSTIKPESWSEMGGPGTIEYYPLGMALVVSQTPDIQEQIAELLNALRRLQDVEITIEIRFISLREDFFERMGVDFAMNILTDNAKFAPIIQANRGTPFGFQPKSFVGGLAAPFSGVTTDSIPFTPDLNIPIAATSFGASQPPFGSGGATGTDGGLSLGLAFLSDIQVFLFLDAAQGDSRSNVMTAPKITLFNGQTSTITVATTQYFVTNVTAVETGAGSVLFIPTNTPFAAGMTLALSGVVSADRRFVRMNLAPTLRNIAGSELFPITTFITPTVEGGLPGQPVPFTQFLQSPTVDTISVLTTVNVPDGGTVVLGGLKLMNEQRNELGPPILSKLPYINRLFKNVGYGRESSNLMIMVTPRIIINEEEETRQTGVGLGLGLGGGAPQVP